MATEIYNLTGVREFTFPHPVRYENQLTVEVRPGGVVSPADYEVTGQGPQSTGVTVRYPSAPVTTDAQLVITRYVEPERAAEFPDDRGITARALNAEFDNIYRALIDFGDGLSDEVDAILNIHLPDQLEARVPEYAEAATDAYLPGVVPGLVEAATDSYLDDALQGLVEVWTDYRLGQVLPDLVDARLDVEIPTRVSAIAPPIVGLEFEVLVGNMTTEVNRVLVGEPETVVYNPDTGVWTFNLQGAEGPIIWDNIAGIPANNAASYSVGTGNNQLPRNADLGSAAYSSTSSLLNRANHTGTQAIGTVSGLQGELDALTTQTQLVPTVVTSARAATPSDRGKLLLVTGTATITLPSGWSDGSVIYLMSTTGGGAQFAAGSGATVRVPTGKKAQGRGSRSTLAAVLQGSTWYVMGDLADE